MKLTHTRAFATAGVIAALAIAAPAFAQRSADRRATNAKQQAQTSQSDRRAEPRETARPPAPSTQTSSRPQQTSRQEPPARPQQPTRPEPSVRPQTGPTRQVEPSRPTPQTGRRDDSQGRAIPRPSGPPNPPARDDRWNGRQDDRRDDRWIDRRDDRRFVIVAPRPSWGGFRLGFGAPRHIVRVYQPYYTFQPRARFSFGLSIGYPVAYPTWYDPYPAYGYALAPGVRYGGISFDIDPYDAAVFIDGNYVGVVDDFSPYDAPLTLRAGLHRIELRSRNFQPMVFDITIVPGQVIPYRGTLSYER